MRTKLAALITAAAVTLTPVSVANAKDNSSNVTKEVKQSSAQSSKNAKSSKIPGSSKTSGDKSSLPSAGLGDNPTESFLIDTAIALGIWAVLGSIYGAVIAPNAPSVNIYDMLPFLRG